MRKLLLIFFVLLLSKISLAESSECNKEIDPKQWTNCIGTKTFANGHKYVGEYKDNKMHGQGTYTWTLGEFAGDKYVGEFKDDKRHGQGTYTYADGEKYVGEHKDNKRHGQGTYTYASGDKYVGEIKDGKRHGQGTYTFANGTVKKGIWKNNKLVEPN